MLNKSACVLSVVLLLSLPVIALGDGPGRDRGDGWWPDHRGERYGRGHRHERGHGFDHHRYGRPPALHHRGAPPPPRHECRGWQRGRWYHGHHSGRHGWWWIVGGAWHRFPAPVYPYPEPIVVVPLQAVPAPAVPATPAEPSGQYWYYCSDPQGYYPYVQDCNVPWQAVPASP